MKRQPWQPWPIAALRGVVASVVVAPFLWFFTVVGQQLGEVWK